MRSLLIAAVAALALAGAAQAAPHCVKGKACGNTCIKATDVCHVDAAAPAPVVKTTTKTTTTTTAAATTTTTAKRCKDPKTKKFTKCATPGAVPA
jgi:hypothetical protein